MTHRALVAAWAVVATVVTACGGGGGSGADGPHDEEIVAAIEAIWTAVGVPPDKPYLGGYDYATHKGTRPCQHLPEDQRWYAGRGSIGTGRDGNVTQAALHDAAIAYFVENGYTIERWRTSSPDAPASLGLIAHREAEHTAISISIRANASATRAVRMGPCAMPTLDGFTEALYDRVPDWLPDRDRPDAQRRRRPGRCCAYVPPSAGTGGQAITRSPKGASFRHRALSSPPNGL